MKSLLFGLVLLLAVSTSASALTFNFEADLVSVTPDATLSSIVDTAAGFSTITGTLAFDPTSFAPFSANIGVYDFPTLTIDQFSVAGISGNPGEATSIYNDVVTAGPVCCTDGLISGNDGFTPAESPGLYEAFGFVIRDSTATAFSSLALPTALDLADFDLTALYLYGSGWNGTGFDGGEFIEYRITGISEVPLPGALVLFFSGAALLLGFGRSRV